MDALSHWNYRVLELVDSRKNKYYAIYEVYYDKKENVVSYTVKPVEPTAESVEGIVLDLLLYLEALSKPVIIAKDLPFNKKK